ncbi:hypothetical protein VFPPC_11371 [Pochonia chlamydosporia 170]|uniref:BTB domain-containing protein n=1 Tax=Pochonia chlamydosporia 170 TaxID=1380566 RepID=A0A179F0H6_METCM|nr:hypothetical protein VFPPC_11371 [Pochonia chlamydosporia 170]OAQ58902.1 hypothetical protein VFPPC_11371 [Pochonia chlamydosporia 170]
MTAALAASKPFRFIVGPCGRGFTIHSGIVASLSAPLERLVNGEMQEATNGEVDWKVVDEGTFMCFWQYAYRGDYDIDHETTKPDTDSEEKTTVPGDLEGIVDPIEKRMEEESTLQSWGDPAEPAPELADGLGDGWNNWVASTRKKKDKKKKGIEWLAEEIECKAEEPRSLSKQEQLWARLVALRRTSHCPELNHLARVTEARGAFETKVQLLCHAKVYVFADCYGIVPLMALSFNKLHESLVNLNRHAESLAGFVTLMPYCYETPAPDDLKNIVVLFAACEVERLRKNRQFEDLLEAHAEMGRDMFWAVLERLE